jgi:hypothetical protein
MVDFNFELTCKTCKMWQKSRHNSEYFLIHQIVQCGRPRAHEMNDKGPFVVASNSHKYTCYWIMIITSHRVLLHVPVSLWFAFRLAIFLFFLHTIQTFFFLFFFPFFIYSLFFKYYTTTSALLSTWFFTVFICKCVCMCVDEKPSVYKFIVFFSCWKIFAKFLFFTVQPSSHLSLNSHQFWTLLSHLIFTINSLTALKKTLDNWINATSIWFVQKLVADWEMKKENFPKFKGKIERIFHPHNMFSSIH